MAGLRYNTGKLKWSLVSWKALAPMVRVLMFGARKYGKLFVPLLEQKLKQWNVKIVNETGRLEQKGCVALATSRNSLIAIKSIKQTGLSTKKSTDKKMLKDLRKLIGNVILQEQMIPSTKVKGEIGIILENMVSQQKNLTKEVKEIANYVEKNLPLCTQIIVMKLENLEVSFAVSAITGLDSSMTALKLLEKLSNTSLNPEEFVINGNHNWKKGLKYTEVTESLQRHLNAFIEGEENDPESKLSHVGHILCNAMFLSYMSLFRNDMDDRYIDENIKEE